MTRPAIRGKIRVIAVGVTQDATRCQMSAGQRERRLTVIEGGRLPGRRRMALGAVMAELIAHVIG